MLIAEQITKKVQKSLNEIKASGRVGISFITKASGAPNDRIALTLRPDAEKYLYHIVDIIKESKLGSWCKVEDWGGNHIFVTSNKSQISLKRSDAQSIATDLRKRGFTIISD
jgi:3'-phosphoadenosine 5'-phosphosulfate sulfotransferase